MMQISIIEKINTTFGYTLVVNTEDIIVVGDQVTDGTDIYTVKKVIMPSRPMDDHRFAIVVEK